MVEKYQFMYIKYKIDANKIGNSGGVKILRNIKGSNIILSNVFIR